MEVSGRERTRREEEINYLHINFKNFCTKIFLSGGVEDVAGVVATEYLPLIKNRLQFCQEN
jgi:hypothetical protein